MFSKQIQVFQELPVPDSKRKCTDVFCIFFGSIFAIAMFIASLALFSLNNYTKMNFPTDSDFKTCGGDLNLFPYVYFNNPQDLTTRICVSSCPKTNDMYIQCSPTKAIPSCIKGSGTNVYDTKLYQDRYGMYCVPTDDNLAKNLQAQITKTNQQHFMIFWDVSWFALLFALIIGIIFMILIQNFSEIMIIITWILSGVILITIGILLLADNPSGWQNNQAVRISFGIISLLIGVFILILFLIYRKNIKLCSIFIKYSTLFLSSTPLLLLYIPIYLIITLALIVLCVWQFIAFNTMGNPVISSNDIFWHSSHNGVPLEVLTAIQFFWGIQFLRDSFNYMVSGNSIQWYFTHNSTHPTYPVVRYFMKNFGTIIGGSLLNILLLIPEFIVNILKCEKDGCCGKLSEPCQFCCGWLLNLLNLVRNDAYAYVNLTGIPYCNSAVQCATLCDKTKLFSGSQSCLSIYRVAAHIVNIGIVFFISYGIMRDLTKNVSIIGLVVVIFGAFCICTFMIGIHGDGASGLQISFLLEYQMQRQNFDTMSFCYANLRQQIEQLQQQFKR